MTYTLTAELSAVYTNRDIADTNMRKRRQSRRKLNASIRELRNAWRGLKAAIRRLRAPMFHL
jgi:uncharacterized coiled-coil DUF342 family protein